MDAETVAGMMLARRADKRDMPDGGFVLTSPEPLGEVERSLADVLRVPQDAALTERALQLYRSGRDAEAEAMSRRVADTEQLGTAMLAIARRRLGVALRRMSAQHDYAACVAAVPPDVAVWLDSGVGPGEEEAEAAPSLSATHALLLRAQAMVGRQSWARRKAEEVAEAAEVLMVAVAEAEEGLAEW